ncbi:hypothetical protein BACCAP_04403 [Pseudoflavonifractor capillosus ATCC 29799]|uniref:Uncharacterized protein n=1 Tax=Pseudoflavonifractor capillosus ATCC 29799 TaxID=411467 RepID=A6P1N1_9FIRM|nr:hypothetical protein BACCAP_04403 [Pseudoflavonifractor capillosus ATCC 29799]
MHCGHTLPIRAKKNNHLRDCQTETERKGPQKQFIPKNSIMTVPSFQHPGYHSRSGGNMQEGKGTSVVFSRLGKKTEKREERLVGLAD